MGQGILLKVFYKKRRNLLPVTPLGLCHGKQAAAAACSLYFHKYIFFSGAKGAAKIFGKILPLGARFDPVTGKTLAFLVNPAAYIAYMHFVFLLFVEFSLIVF